jgi:hypothetical protein
VELGQLVTTHLHEIDTRVTHYAGGFSDGAARRHSRPAPTEPAVAEPTPGSAAAVGEAPGSASD